MSIRVNRFAITDPIYDFVDNVSPSDTFYEIIDTQEFKRLNGIKQAGITAFFGDKRQYTRYEHCIGVYMLLKFNKVSDDKCIAGLLHDVYHTVMSHSIDNVFTDEKNKISYHELIKYEYFETYCKNIIHILAKKFPRYKPTDFLDGELTEITKNKSFGADIIDYFMRDGFHSGMITKKFVNKIIKNIGVIDNKFYITDMNLAKKLFTKTIQINSTLYMSPTSRGQYKLFEKILKEALKIKLICKEDFFDLNMTDEKLVSLLRKDGDCLITTLFSALDNIVCYSFSQPQQKKYECSCERWQQIDDNVIRKLRCINPICAPDMKELSIINQSSMTTLNRNLHEHDEIQKLFVKSSINIPT